MGSSASKASRAVGGAARQYPVRPAPPSTNAARRPPPPPPAPAAVRPSPGPTNRPRPQASNTRSEAINLDASDPHFAQSLRSLGAVQPNPTLSQSSAFPTAASHPRGPDPRSNPAIAILEARARIQDEADREFMEAGKRGHAGREFLDVYTIRKMLVMRDGQGKSFDEIEKALGLRKGCVERLGTVGVVELAQEVGRAEREITMV